MAELIKHERYELPAREDTLFDEKPSQREADAYCQARHLIKRGENAGKWTYCRNEAGKGTNHLGFGRCKFHGGSLTAVENRYARLLNPSYGELVEEFYNDPDPLNLRAELAVARAILQDTLDNHEQWNEQLMAWHASFHKDNRGLHDMPLYHIRAVQDAVEKGYVKKGMTNGAFQDGLERAVAEYNHKWSQSHGREPVLRMERPRKAFVDVGAALKALAEIRHIAKTTAELEEKAYLSVFSFEDLLQKFTEVIFEVVQRQLSRSGASADVAIEIFNEIAERWEAIPVTSAKSSVPRLEAQTRKSRAVGTEDDRVRPEAES